MLIAYWIVAGLAALGFLLTGVLKLVRPREALVGMGLGWAADFSRGVIRLIAALEVIGAIGLIVPFATGVAPVLSPLAAVGLAIIMAGAIATHIRRKEPPIPPAVLLLLSAAAAVLGFAILA